MEPRALLTGDPLTTYDNALQAAQDQYNADVVTEQAAHDTTIANAQAILDTQAQTIEGQYESDEGGALQAAQSAADTATGTLQTTDSSADQLDAQLNQIADGTMNQQISQAIISTTT